MTRPLRIALAAVFIASAGAAHADLLVVEQSGTGYKSNQKLSDGASLDVPSGAHVKFRRLPDGTDIVIEGPFEGPISKYRKGDCAWWNPGCKKDNPVTPGGLRGAPPSPGTGGVEPVPGAARKLEPAPGATRGMD